MTAWCRFAWARGTYTIVSYRNYTKLNKRDLRRSQFLDAEACQPLAHVHAVFDRLALDDTSSETSGESVTKVVSTKDTAKMMNCHLPSTVGVGDVLLRNLVDVPLLDLNFTAGLHGSGDGGQSTLGDDGEPGAVGVLLGKLSKLLGDLDNVFGAPAVALGVRTSLGLVAEGVVGVGENGVKLVLEELRDERSRERKHEGLFYTISNVQEIYEKEHIPCSSKQLPQREPRWQEQRPSGGNHQHSRAEHSQPETRSQAASSARACTRWRQQGGCTCCGCGR